MSISKARAIEQIKGILGRRSRQALRRDRAKTILDQAEQNLREVNLELEGVMRAAKLGMPGKEDEALEIGELKLKIVESENRYVQEKPLLAGLVPLFGDQEDPVVAARGFLGEYTKVTPYSYVSVRQKGSKEKEE